MNINLSTLFLLYPLAETHCLNCIKGVLIIIMFYDVFFELCEKKGVKPSRAAEECGINKSSVSNWKNNGYMPRGDTLNQIASYFNVSVDYLLGNEQNILWPKAPISKLRSVARLEETPITPEQDREIADYIDFLLKKKGN